MICQFSYFCGSGRLPGYLHSVDSWTLCLPSICRAGACSRRKLRILKPWCLRGIISSTNLNLSNRFAPHQSLPCVRGGGPPNGGSEGLCSMHLFYCKVSAKSYCGNNPSVKNQKIFDSSLYTREPWALPRQRNKLEFDGGYKNGFFRIIEESILRFELSKKGCFC